MGEPNGANLKFPLEWKEIMDLLPHRYPFLLLDRITDGVPGVHVKAYKNVSWNDPWFQGHFPYAPVMPGVLQLEALSQTAAILAHVSAEFDTSTKVPFLMSMDKVKFRRPVQPGDRLDLIAEQVKLKSTLLKAHCVASVDGQKTCEMTVTAAIRPKAEAFGEPSQIKHPQLGTRPWEMALGYFKPDPVDDA